MDVRYYQQFQCLAESCPDCCCRGFKIELDTVSCNVYDNFTGRLRQLAIENTVEQNGKRYMRSKDGVCTLLTDSGLCRMQLEGGSEALCYTCRVYPRVNCELDGDKYQCLLLSCPAACELILQSGISAYPMLYNTYITDIYEVIEKITKAVFPGSICGMRWSSAFPYRELVLPSGLYRCFLSAKTVEALVCYFCMRYASEPECDWRKIAYYFTCVASLYIQTLQEMNESIFSIISRLAKEIEHSSEQIQHLCRCF